MLSLDAPASVGSPKTLVHDAALDGLYDNDLRSKEIDRVNRTLALYWGALNDVPARSGDAAIAAWTAKLCSLVRESLRDEPKERFAQIITGEDDAIKTDAQLMFAVAEFLRSLSSDSVRETFDPVASDWASWSPSLDTSKEPHVTSKPERIMELIRRLGNLADELPEDDAGIALDLRQWAVTWRDKGLPGSPHLLIDRLIDRAEKAGVDISSVQPTLLKVRAEVAPEDEDDERA